jgi:hypothetical protein
MTGIFQAFTGHHRYHGSKKVTSTAGNDKTPAPLPEILLKKHQRKKKNSQNLRCTKSLAY